jgi:hypothetical protein
MDNIHNMNNSSLYYPPRAGPRSTPGSAKKKSRSKAASIKGANNLGAIDPIHPSRVGNTINISAASNTAIPIETQVASTTDINSSIVSSILTQSRVFGTSNSGDATIQIENSAALNSFNGNSVVDATVLTEFNSSTSSSNIDNTEVATIPLESRVATKENTDDVFSAPIHTESMIISATMVPIEPTIVSVMINDAITATPISSPLASTIGDNVGKRVSSLNSIYRKIRK